MEGREVSIDSNEYRIWQSERFSKQTRFRVEETSQLRMKVSFHVCLEPLTPSDLISWEKDCTMDHTAVCMSVILKKIC